MTTLTCQYCGFNTTRKSDLTRHQKKTVYCLELQQKKEDDKSTLVQPQVTLKPILTYKEQEQMLIRFEEQLKSKDYQLRSKDEQIALLKDQISKLTDNQQNITLAAISKPTTTQVKNTIKNCNIQNLTPLSDEEMREQSRFLTKEHINAGPEGYVKYALEYPLKNKVTCTDVSRKKLAWKDVDGKVIMDTEGSQLAQKFFTSLKDQNKKLCKDIIIEMRDRRGDAASRRDDQECEVLDALVDKIATWRTEVLSSSEGHKTDLKDDFIRYLCTASKSSS